MPKTPSQLSFSDQINSSQPAFDTYPEINPHKSYDSHGTSDADHKEKPQMFESIDILTANNHLGSASQTTYFCKDQEDESGGFMAIPHLGAHGTGSAAFVSRVFERWLMDKAFLTASNNPSSLTNILPFFNISGEELADSFSYKLHQEINSAQFVNHLKACVTLRLGKTSDLAIDSDDNIRLVAQQFMSTYPLYLDVSVQNFYSHKSSIKGSDSNIATPIGSVSSHFSLELDDVSSEDFDDQKNLASVANYENHTEIRFFVNS